ncbi:MAG: hypothetical protein RLZZ401_59 [Pseudomonadota bacterium]
MEALVMGLVLFLGLHSVRIVASDWRTQMVGMLGEKGYKGLYTVGSLLGLGLIVWGYGLARQAPSVVWLPPLGMRHAAALLTLVAFILVTAAYVPRNHLKARMGHPMVLGTKAWALGHLLANGNLADVLLFGGFLAWAIVDFVSLRRRDRVAGVVAPAGTTRGTGLTVLLGVVLWGVFAFALHGPLIGVQPLG